MPQLTTLANNDKKVKATNEYATLTISKGLMSGSYVSTIDQAFKVVEDAKHLIDECKIELDNGDVLLEYKRGERKVNPQYKNYLQ